MQSWSTSKELVLCTFKTKKNLLLILCIFNIAIVCILQSKVSLTTQFIPIVNKISTRHQGVWEYFKTSQMDSNAPENLRADAKEVQRLAILHKMQELDCAPLFDGNKTALKMAILFANTSRKYLADESFLDLTENCNNFTYTQGYVMSSLTDEEREFPIAYSMLVYKDADMVERLLRAIYRPQNYYCIHVDNKSSDNFYNAIKAIANCFDNVFLTSKRISVYWGRYSVLEPELMCMAELWRFKKWKYFINLTGQEFPLRTNYELVQIFTAYNGANDLSSTIKKANRKRWGKSPPPHGIRPVKGSVHIAVNRDFVDYILHNDTAKDFLEWVKHTSFPDETFFAVLNHNPQLGIRGSYKGVSETGRDKPFLTRYKSWNDRPCAGKHVRGVCILSTGDLPLLGVAEHYFANKFYLHEDGVVIGCLEERIFNNTRDEYLGIKYFNTSFYENLGFVKNRVT